jgi:hypothetical protein
MMLTSMPPYDKPSVDQPSIVFVGSFNPAIFHPSWFGQHGLLREGEAKADIKIVHPHVSQFKLDWLQLQVTTEQFVAVALDSGHALPLRDLVLGTFGLLEHTPIRAIGLNRAMHFPLQSEDRWHAIGDALVPKNVWRRLLAGRPGLLALSVEGNRPGASSKYVRIQVQPSTIVEYGIAIISNEHFDVAGASTSAPPDEGADTTVGRTASAALTVIRQNWEGAQDFASKVAHELVTQTATMMD